jgi:hypothetical protein
MAASAFRPSGKLALVQFLLLFGCCGGEDVIVKVDKYAKVPADCDAAITNLEVGVATGIVVTHPSPSPKCISL